MEAIQPGCVSTHINTDQIGEGSSDGVDSSGYEQVDIYESSSTALAEDAIQDVLPKQAAVSDEDGYECVETADLVSYIHCEMETTCQQPSCHYPDQNVQDDDYSLYKELPVSLHADDDIPPQQCISVLAPPLPAQRSSYAQIPIPGSQVFPTIPVPNQSILPSPRSSQPGSSVSSLLTMPSVASQPALSEDSPSSTSEQVQFDADQLQTLVDMYERLGKFFEKSQSTPVNLASLSSFRPQNVPDSNENPPPLLSKYENIYDEVEQSGATKLLQNTSEQPKPPVPKPRKSKLKVSQPPPHLEADAQGKPCMSNHTAIGVCNISSLCSADSEPPNQYVDMKM